MEYQYSRRDVVDMHFFALLDWKRNYKNSTFEELLRLLKKVEVNTCVLCEVSVNVFYNLVYNLTFKVMSLDILPLTNLCCRSCILDRVGPNQRTSSCLL
jgi:hypothetical protein